MRAFFDPADGAAKVEIEINGTTPNFTKRITALLDTGHSGSLSLSIFDLIEIGAKLSSFGPVVYANGQQSIAYYFSVNVTVDGDTKEVQAAMIESATFTEAIAGMQLFVPYVAFIDFKNKNINFIKEEELRKTYKAQIQKPPPPPLIPA